MGGSIAIFLDSGTSHVLPSLGKNYLFYPLIFPKNKAPKVKRGLKTLCAACMRSRSLWSKGRWKPYVWGWFWCIIVTGISSGVWEIEIWRDLDFWSNFPLFFCVCILSDFRAISAPQTSLIDRVSYISHSDPYCRRQYFLQRIRIIPIFRPFARGYSWMDRSFL